jgi:hypothetical protein
MPLPAIALALAPKLVEIVGGWIDKAVPDKNLAVKLKHDMQSQLLPLMQMELTAQRDIIVAEAQSESWIARSWRPITMLTFVTLVVAKWLGWTAPGITPDQELALLDIIKVGLGGYVVGRSGEKIMKAYKS